MNDAVFISDLHLNPNEPAITERFHRFIEWASTHTRRVYILGDLFHVWPGDDALDAWSYSIAKALSSLNQQGISLYFMPGNRDFLLGTHFATQAGMTYLNDPFVITLGNERILLVHGDRYCTADRGHQWLRRLTRNGFFPSVFLRLPLQLRLYLVQQVRQRSQSNRTKPAFQMDVVVADVLAHMQAHQVRILVHGHTHQPGLTTHVDSESHQQDAYRRYVLSDWDDNPLIMCYDKSTGFYFNRLLES